MRAEDANTRVYSPNGVPLAYHSRTISGLNGDQAVDDAGAISGPPRTDVSAQESTTLDECWALLCSRCDLAYHVDGDTLCSACRAEIDAAFAELPGAEV